MYDNDNPILTEIHTADIHFGAFNPKIQYDMLIEKMLNKISNIHFDAFFINGDLFHHKYMANSDAIYYAIRFIDDVIRLCLKNNATLVLLHGTYTHDADQLKLFYNCINRPNVDIRIVETARFEYIKGTKVLCIPEEYNKGYEYYQNLLLYSGDYDMVAMHGNIKGAIYGMNHVDLNSIKSPVFDINCFIRCKGPIFCGHSHIAGCYSNHIYYSGSPLRWQFGEEYDKGFIICVYDKRNHGYYNHFETIESFRYDTVVLDELLNRDPSEIINYILTLKANGIDFLKVRFSNSNTTTDVIKQYFNNKSDIIIDVEDDDFRQIISENSESEDTCQKNCEKYKFLFDGGMSPYEALANFININEGDQFITVDELCNILDIK